MLSASNWVSVDPLAPKRPMTQFEHGQASSQFGINGINTVHKGVGPKQLQEATEKFYEWYPVVGKRPIPRDGIYWLEDGVVRETSYVEDVNNNKVIHTVQDYYDVIEDTFREFRFGIRYPFGPRLYKVDVPFGIEHPALNNGIGYVLMVPADHGIMEGKSHRVLRNFINGYLEDRGYRPSIPVPQTIPNTSCSLCHEGVPFRELEVSKVPPVDQIGHEKGSKVPQQQRGLSFNQRRLSRGDLQHPKKYAMTGMLSGIVNYIHLALLSDYTQDKQKVTHGCNVPFSADHSKYIRIMDGDVKDMIGCDVLSFQMIQSMDKEKPQTLFQFLDHSEKVYREGMKEKDQVIFNSRYEPFVPVEFNPPKEALLNTLSNFGDLKMRKGVIDTTSAYGFSTYLIGTLLIALAGQPDGSIIMNTMALKTVYSNRYLELFSKTLLILLKKTLKEDVKLEDLRALPEYKEMLEIIRNK